MARHVILINGLGNRSFLYRLVAFLWRLSGVDMHFFRFNWEDTQESFESKMQRLTLLSEQFDDVAVIGVSAGGTAALNLLARHPTISKVVTISSPYYLNGPVQSKLLTQSDAQLQANLANFTTATKQKILSLHGRQDITVEPRQSQADGIAHRRLKSSSHAMTIAYALTFGSGILRRFLRT